MYKQKKTVWHPVLDDTHIFLSTQYFLTALQKMEFITNTSPMSNILQTSIYFIDNMPYRKNSNTFCKVY